MILKNQGGGWTPPKDECEEGETTKVAAIRETLEEIGLYNELDYIIDLKSPIKSYYNIKCKHIECHYFLAKINKYKKEKLKNAGENSSLENAGENSSPEKACESRSLKKACENSLLENAGQNRSIKK